MRTLILFKNGVEVGRFLHNGPMHKYVDRGREKDQYARFWAIEDERLAYHYRTRHEIEFENELHDKICELQQEISQLRVEDECTSTS